MTHNQQICKTLKFAFKLLQNYIGVGLSRDSYHMKNSDVVACVRDGILFLFMQISKWKTYEHFRIDGFYSLLGNSIQSEHYLLEDVNSTPHRHKLKINLAGAGVDSETGFTWCSFTRNIEPKGTYDLDLRRHYYQIYLWGEWNVSESRYYFFVRTCLIDISKYC